MVQRNLLLKVCGYFNVYYEDALNSMENMKRALEKENPNTEEKVRKSIVRIISEEIMTRRSNEDYLGSSDSSKEKVEEDALYFSSIAIYKCCDSCGISAEHHVNNRAFLRYHDKGIDDVNDNWYVSEKKQALIWLSMIEEAFKR